MNSLLMNIHVFIIAFVAYELYEIHEVHEKKKSNLEFTKKKLEKKLKKKQDEIKIIKQFEDKRAEASKQFEEVEAEFEVIRKKLPSKFNHNENKNMFIRTAEKLNIKNAVMDGSNSKEEDRDFYLLQKYKLKGEGTFLQFLILLERISESERLFNISSLSFKDKKNSERGRFSLIDGEVVIEAYAYNSNFFKKLEQAEKEKQEKKRNKDKKKKKKKKKKR